MTHDAIVIGAGPAGGVTALMLARAGWSVALVEKSEFPRRKVCGEYLSPTNLPLFAELGLTDAIAAASGPEIRRMALYARNAAPVAPLPRPANTQWGRAIAREFLDTILRDAARSAGAHIHQPFSVSARTHDGTHHTITLAHRAETRILRSRILIDAGGNADRPATPHRASDLLGVKAHFHHADLPPDLMPLLVFPGGYGGLVTTSENRVTFGCCIRRDVIERARAATPGPAAEAILAYVKQHCEPVAAVLRRASLAGPWLGTGPIAPGIRPRYAGATYRVGTAAGETHPLVGEGMSMAMQAAWLLATTLTTTPDPAAAARLYATAWRRRFGPRIRAASAFAHLAMRRETISLLLPVLTRLPALLTLGAAHSGKTRLVVGLPTA
jgi:flavin-dependent dehydrogenase